MALFLPVRKLLLLTCTVQCVSGQRHNARRAVAREARLSVDREHTREKGQSCSEKREKARRNIAAKASRAFARSHFGKLAHNSDIMGARRPLYTGRVVACTRIY